MESVQSVQKGLLEQMFELQEELQDILFEKGKIPKWPIDINTREGQKWIDTFIYCVVKEWSEYWEWMKKIESASPEERKKLRYESDIELADIVHFLLEIALYLGLNHKDFYPHTENDFKDKECRLFFPIAISIPFRVWNCCNNLLILTEFLQMAKHHRSSGEDFVDSKEFNRLFIKAFESHFDYICGELLTPIQLMGVYRIKNQINRERQGNDY